MLCSTPGVIGRGQRHDARVTQAVECRCSDLAELRGEDARRYAADHLRLIERARDPDSAEDYQCDETRTAWVIDYPSRNEANDRRGEPRLRRLPLAPGAPPVGGPWE